MTRRLLLWCGKIDTAKRGDAEASRADIEIVLQSAKTRGFREADTFAFVCDRVLLPPYYTGRIQIPTTETLRTTLETIAAGADRGDLTLLVATNHGVRGGGLVVDTPPPNEFEATAPAEPLSPEILGRLLDRLPGSQVIVLGVCYAGWFCTIGTTGRAVYAAAPKDREILFSNPPRTKFIHDFFRAWQAGTSFSDAFLAAHRDPIRDVLGEDPIVPESAGMVVDDGSLATSGEEVDPRG